METGEDPDIYQFTHLMTRSAQVTDGFCVATCESGAEKVTDTDPTQCRTVKVRSEFQHEFSESLYFK